ncbi:MAG: PH domain-containing protein [Intrasporangium sp.]|uniref:PH domain-containing protein n=1 Tax=Intrasporangium sp. TaxID=1925024 RepID=UPI00264827D3|nr:PH domain-containing protein [Intrasporangium sp.]MDN5797546.1 PH domain-containing protein [Intrasporangium sp.]
MSEPAAPDPSAAFAPFRPRRGRIVALGVLWGSLVLFGVLAALLPTVSGQAVWGLVDRLMFFAIGVVIALLAWRYASLRAVPSREGLVVRNLVNTRRLEWAQIVSVQFGGGLPWVSLDLDDLDTLAVMAIQKADGAYAEQEATRLAALIQELGEPADPDVDGKPR